MHILQCLIISSNDTISIRTINMSTIEKPPVIQEIPNPETIPPQIPNPETIQEPSLLDKARNLATNFRNKIAESLPGRSPKEISEVTGEALADFAIDQTEQPRTEDQAEETKVAFVAVETEAVEESLIGTAEDPVIALVDAGTTSNVVEGIRDIADSGKVEVAEALAEDLEAIEDHEAFENGATTASRYMIDAEGLTTAEIKKKKNNPEAWEQSRREWHAEELALQRVDALELSRKFGDPPRITAMRGACGSGKTTSVKEKYGDRDIFDESGDVPGAIKPDYNKGRVKHKGETTPPPPGVELTSSQVHLESTAMTAMLTEILAADPEATLLIDKQLEAADDMTSIIEMGKEYGKPVEILDHDVPVELSAFRVLKRPYGGVDPNIGYDGVSSGFRGIRQNRAALIEQVETEEVVDSYALRTFDPVSRRQIVIANKVDGQIKVDEEHSELYQSVSLQTDEDIEQEIETAANAEITEEFIEGFISRNFDESEGSAKYRDEARRILGAYVGLGMTFKEALDSKASGIETDSESGAFTSVEDCRARLLAWKAEQGSKND